MAKVALFHDNFAQMGGAERVADALACAMPSAKLHSTLAVHSKLIDELRDRNIQTTWMQRLPSIDRYYRHYFLLYPLAIEGVNLSQYDMVVSSCFGYAKGVHRRSDAVHVCYCHTPMRWVWRYDDYSSHESFGVFRSSVLPPLLTILRQWDLRAAKRPDYFIANSQTVADRIRQVYGRESTVIHPPIDLNRFALDSVQQDYYLVLARLVAYKRIHLAIQACNMLKRRLIIIGDGPDRRRLERLAGPTIEFKGRQAESAVREATAQCRALLFPGEEDFGLTPLEANASGRPVIAYRAGGALETVRQGETGVFFEAATPASLAEAIESLDRMKWQPGLLRQHAAAFDRPLFLERIRSFLRSVAPSAKLREVFGAC